MLYINPKTSQKTNLHQIIAFVAERQVMSSYSGMNTSYPNGGHTGRIAFYSLHLHKPFATLQITPQLWRG